MAFSDLFLIFIYPNNYILMKNSLGWYCILVECFFSSLLWAQEITTVFHADQSILLKNKSIFSETIDIDTVAIGSVKINEFFEPALMMTYGVIRINNNLMHGFDRMLKSNLQKNAGPKRKVDDVVQYLPTVTFLGLDFMGVKAKNSFKNRFLYGTAAHLLMGITVNIMKNSFTVQRPEQSASNSFPSGHTATAFVGAELLWQEYKDESIWYGISGYTLAAGTGFFRMYNNRHWFSDIVMGAGIGIASVKLTYLLFPLIQQRMREEINRLVLQPYMMVYTKVYPYG